ncbi:MAG: hypothetical protein Fur007_10430 [Rhodoferax sp.]
MGVPAQAQLSAGLPMPESMPQALAQALARHSPLVVMVSLPGCPFCKIARENYLTPLTRAGDLSVVQLDMRNQQPVVGFDGVRQTQDQLVRAWKVKVAPTVLFFGPGGVEVAARLEGGYIPDFYGFYLDERVQAARAAIARH